MSCVSREEALVPGTKRLKDEEMGEVGRKLYELLFLELEKDIVMMVVIKVVVVTAVASGVYVLSTRMYKVRR